MPTTVEIPTIGRVEFPDEMASEAIEAESARLYDEANPKPASLVDRIKASLAPKMEALATAARAGVEAIGEAESANVDANVQAGETLRKVPEFLDAAAALVPAPLPGAAALKAASMVARPLTPIGQLPRVAEQEGRSTAGQVAAGVANVAATAAEGVLTPIGLATLGASALPVAAQRVIAGAFGLDMARHLPAMAEDAVEAVRQGSVQGKVEALGNLAVTAGMAAAAGKHAATSTAKVAARGLANELGRSDIAKSPGTEPAPYVLQETPVERGFRYRGQQPEEMAPGPETTPLNAPDPRPVAPPENTVSAADVLTAAEAVMGVDAKDATGPVDLEAVRARAEEIRGEANAGGAEAAVRAVRDGSPTERAAVRVGIGLSDSASDALRSGAIDIDEAMAIAAEAPGDGNLQGVGIAAILDGGTAEDAVRAIKEFRDIHGEMTDAVDAIVEPPDKSRETPPERPAQPQEPNEEAQRQEVRQQEEVLTADQPAPAAELPTPSAGGVTTGAGGEIPPESSARGDAAGSPLALPPGTTPTSGKLMTVAVNPITSRRVDMPTVFRQLEAVMQTAGSNTPIRVGRMGVHKRWASGIFRPVPEVIRLDSALNLPTATHEVAHSLAHSWWRRSQSSPGQRGYRQAPGNWFRQNLPKPAAKELYDAGVALYGARKPAAGYVEEGWSEFVRSYLTEDDVATKMPAAFKWFTEVQLPKVPDTAKALRAARDLIDVWRGQGALGRQQAMMKPLPGRVQKALKSLRSNLSYQAQVEQFSPLAQISKFWQGRTGKPLSPGEDPYLIATRVRGIAPTVMERFLHDQPIDIDGNPTGAKSLAEALTPLIADLPWGARITHALMPSAAKAVRQRISEFSAYLHARRTLERASQGKQTGLSIDDARAIIAQYDSPKFQTAAAAYYRWWDSVLDYYAGASQSNADLVKAIRQGSSDYVPLSRVMDADPSTRISERESVGGGLRRMHGSNRPIYDIFETTIQTAEKLIERAHRDLVAQSVIDLHDKPGMGWMVEKVPVEQVRQRVSMARLRDALDDLGVDTTAIPDDALIEYYTRATRPAGVDAVRPVKTANGVEWFAINPEVAAILEGVDSPKVAAGPVLKAFAASNRMFKMGATGMRLSFQLLTNPTRDVVNELMQIQAGGNPARLFAAHMLSLFDVFRSAVTGKGSEYWEALHRLGVPMSNPLAHDVASTRSAAKGLWHGRVLRGVAQPVNTFREMIGGMENYFRSVQLRLKAAEVAWRPGMQMTREQAVALAVAAKRVTTDFTAGGSVGKRINMYVPFFNASIQGTRAAGRTLRAAVDSKYAARVGDSQGRALGRIAVGGTWMTLLSLANWYRNKDEEWYRALPWRERFLYTNIRVGNEVLRIPRPPEWGNLFMVAPEALADAWYSEDPQAAKAAIGHILATTGPIDLSSAGGAVESVLPVPFKVALEQANNKDWFWDRPIVPANEVDILPGDQRGEQTSRFAQILGDAFPKDVSPRRVDALIRQLGGGAAADFVAAVGLGGQMREREPEMADVPLIGRLFRRGGTFTPNSRPVVEFMGLYAYYRARSESKARPLDAREEAFWKRLQSDQRDISRVRKVAAITRDLEPRQKLWQGATRIATAAMKDATALKLDPVHN